MLRLRPFLASDAQGILRWIHDETTFHKWSADRYDHYPITPDDMNRAYESERESGMFIPMTAVDACGLAGHLILRYPNPAENTVRVGYVIVDDARRGRGYGREMLSLALAYAFIVLRAEKVTLGVFTDNEPAKRCYRALGFIDVTPAQPKVCHVMGEDWMCLEMELDVNAYDVSTRKAKCKEVGATPYPMRRRDRAVTDSAGIREILEQCKTCHVAMTDGGAPYVLPLSFGYELEGELLTLWFHSAKTGRKLDILQRDNRVCFEICCEGEPAMSFVNPCNCGYYYACVQGNGRMEFVTELEEKRHALSLLMKRQAGVAVSFTEKQAEAVCVCKVVTRDYIGKRVPRPADRA